MQEQGECKHGGPLLGKLQEMGRYFNGPARHMGARLWICPAGAGEIYSPGGLLVNNNIKRERCV